jgi:hypothetical protein
MRISKKFLIISLVAALLSPSTLTLAQAADTVNPNTTTQAPATGANPVVTSNVPTIPAVPSTGNVPCTPPATSTTTPAPAVDPGTSAPVCVDVPKTTYVPRYTGPLTMTSVQKGLGVSLAWKYGKDQPLGAQTIRITSSTGALNGELVTLANKTRSTTIKGLTPGAKYTFTLKAGTVKSKGKKFVSIIKKLTPVGTPSKVSLLEVKVENNIADLSWVYLGEKLSSLNVGVTIDGSKEVVKILDPKTTTFRINSILSSKSYRFRVFGTNLAGNGPNFIKGIYNSLPSNPLLNVQAVNGVTAKLTWDQPGAPATSYLVSISSPGNLKHGTTLTYDGSISTATITGLSALESYTFTVKATNDLGSAISEPIGISLSFFPSAPQDFKIVPGDKSATLTWKAPLNYGQSIIKNYVVYSSTDKGINWTTATKINDENSINVPGLKNDIVYYFKVTAANDVGEGKPTPTLSVTPTLAPYSASGFLVKQDSAANGGGLFLSWINPTTTTALYKLSYRINGTTAWLPLASGISGTSYRASGLSMATLYDFQLENVNAPTTVNSKLDATGETSPNTPQNLLAKVSGSTVELSWDKSTVGSGGVVSGYKVEYNSGSTWVTAADLVIENKYTFKSYSPLLPFSFRVSAVNRDSIISLASIIASPPTAPLSLTAVPDNKFVTLTWTAPTSFGTNPITGYTVEVATSAAPNTWTVAGTVPSTLSTYVVSPLTNETAYLFRVTANTISGNSSPSTFVTSTPGIKLPSAPLNLAAVPGDKNVTLTWDVPLTTGTSPISGYIIESSVDLGLKWTAVAEVGPFTTFVVPNLNNDTGYRFRVIAKSITGNSTPSIYVTSTSGSTPYGATGFTATGAASSITLNWLAPTGSTVAPVYTINYKVNGTSTWRVLTTGLSALTYTATGLTPATRYDFRLTNTAVPAGVTANVDATGAETSPNAPLNLTSKVNGNTVDLAWEKPIVGTSGTIQGYRIEHSVAPGVWIVDQESFKELTYIFRNYDATVAYSFRVSAHNFDSLYSVPSVVVSPPTKPLTLTATAGEGSATLNWSAPSSSGSTAVSSYTLETSVDQGRTWLLTGNVGLVTSYKVNSITNGSMYYFRVTANTSTGNSAPSDYAQVIPGAAPYTPTLFTGTGAANSVVLSWVAPVVASPLYTVEHRVTGDTAWLPLTGATGLSALTFTATGLTAGTKYEFLLSNTNVPAGLTAEIISAGIETAPRTPLNLKATSASGSVKLVWDRPIIGTGGTILAYKVEYSSGSSWTTAIDRAIVEQYTVTGLTPGTSYSFRVSAINLASVFSAPSETATSSPLPRPSAPTKLAVSTYAGKYATVYFEQPAEFSSGAQGVGTYKYKIEHSLDQVSWVVHNPGSFFTSTVTTIQPSRAQMLVVNGPTANWITPIITGPDFFYTYSYAGQVSVPKVPATTDASGAPVAEVPAYTYTNCVGGGRIDGGLTTKTVDGNGDPICIANFGSFSMTTFTLTSVNSLGGNGASVNGNEPPTFDSYNGCSLTTATLPCQISGLTGGKKYYFRVTTISDTTEGDSATDELIMIGSPSAPLNAKATFNANNIVVTWGSPSNDGGSPITAYVLQYSKDGFTWNVLPSSLGTANCPKITGGVLVSGSTCYAFKPNGMITIPNGLISVNGSLPIGDNQYQFRLKAFNQLSPVNVTSPISLISDATLVTTTQPFTPQSLNAEVLSSSSVKLTWLPSEFGSQSLNNFYDVYMEDITAGTAKVKLANLLNTSLTFTKTGLTPGNTYEFSVRASNSTGGVSPEVVASVTLEVATPSAVTGFVAAPGETLVDLDWKLPTTGGEITSIEVGYKAAADASYTVVTGLSPTLIEYQITGLTNGTTYTFYVITKNATGSSSQIFATAKPVAAAVAANLNLTYTVGSTPDAITLNWNAVSTTPAVNGYKVFYSTNGGSSYTKLYDASVAVVANFNQKLTTPTTLTFNSLPAGVTYTFKVEAWNFPTTGTGNATLKAFNTTTYIMPSATVPSGIGRLTLSSPTTGRIVADWNGFAPSNGGSAITAYDIYYSTDNITYTKAGTVASDSTGSTIDGLPKGQLFYIKVVAVNAVGDGAGVSSSVVVS